MIITCQVCNTRFRLDDKLVRPTGSRARCSVCATIFTVYPESQPPVPVPEVPPQPEISRLADDTFPQTTQPAPDALKSDAPKDDHRGHALGDEGKVDSDDAGAAAFAMMAEDTKTASGADEIPAGEDDLDSFFGDDDEEETDLPSAESESPPMVAAGPDAIISEEMGDDVLQGLDSFFSEADASPEIKPDDAQTAATPEPEAVLDETESVMDDLDDDALMMEISGILDEAQKDEARKNEIRKTDDTALAEGLDDGALTFSDEDLNFSLDLVQEEKPAAAETGSENDDLDVEDLDLSLEMDDTFDGGHPEDTADDTSLDFDADLDFILNMESREDSGAAASAPESPIAEEEHQAPELSHSTTDLSDDLDLSGLDDLLNDSMDVAEHAGPAGPGGEEPELSLDLAGEISLPTMGKDADDDGAEMTLDELKLELEERGTLTGKPATSDTDYSDIDLGEIEQMLDPSKIDAETDESFSPSLDQELDLDIEASLDAEKWMADAAGGMETVVMDEEIDLAEFEEVIDAVDINASVDDSGEEPELELDLDLDDDHVSSETVAVNHDLDFELSDFDGGGGAGGASLQEISRSLDINASNSLDLDVDDDDLEDTVAIHPPEEPVSAADPPASPPVSPPSLTPASPEPAAMEPAPRGVRTAGGKKKSSAGKKVAMAFLILLIMLGAIAGAGYYFVVQQDMEVPYIGEHLDFLKQDPNGTKKLTTEKITSQYIEHSSAGRLFVVSGNVKNGYRENRGVILLKGKLFSKGKEIRQQAVYAGNVMSDLELANLELNKIKERMGNRLGNNQQNMKIPPGRTIPFMIVFSEFEGEPDEFAVELTSSVAAR